VTAATRCRSKGGCGRVEGRDVKVQCRIARGAREHYASIEISDPKG
jgi:hypothetical protein